MNISKVSNSLFTSAKKPQTKQLVKAGIAVTGGLAATDVLIKSNKENVQKEPKTPFGKIFSSIKTVISEASYLKNKTAQKDSKYQGDMLNPVLNDTIAKLNANIYEPKTNNINGFKPILELTDNKTGFRALASRQDNEIIITYRGTQNLQCIKSDFQMMLGKVPEQFKLADRFYMEVKKANPECDITLTGHSLGGSLAQLVSSKYKDVPAVTLNAFGTDTIIKKNKKLFKDNHNTYNFIIKDDVVSNSSKQIGETVMLDRTYEKNCHDMPNYENRWA